MLFRDLNKNGRLDPYEDPCCPVEQRVDDLLSRMTLEEKAGLMFHPVIEMNVDGTLLEGPGRFGDFSTSEMLDGRLISHFNVLPTAGPRPMAEWYNRLQQMAEDTRLGIPVTISSDPRHSFVENASGGVFSGKFSLWPDPVGLAATGDPALVQEFANIARQEYLTVGVRVALHPMADLATEPRWGRIMGTFGEDAALASLMIAAYIRGFQGERFGPQSVACMTKHFPGGGPQKDGGDSHFSFAKEQVYPGDNFNYHLIPFEAAFGAGTAQIMLYYSVPIGTPFEKIGFGFNRDIVAGLLREKYEFDGVVCTDWGMLTDSRVGDHVMQARAWGLEDESVAGRARKAIEAGVDQFGGEACPEVIVDLVRSGQVPESRIDRSVRRLLRDKFRLGLFDNPYVDPGRAEQVVGSGPFRAAGELAQRKSIVLLKNSRRLANRLLHNILPLSGRPRIYIENISPEVASAYGQVVPIVGDADVAILRLQAPFEARDDYLETVYRLHTGDLTFPADQTAHTLSVMEQVPTIVDIYLDRPAVIPEIAEHSAALLADFGASDEAVLDVIFGRFRPSGTLPFELPSSMDAVLRRRGDVPRDSDDPLFAFGHGLNYENAAHIAAVPR
jgi:beta-glucosidase